MPGAEHYRVLERTYLPRPIHAYSAPTISSSAGRAAGAVHGSVCFKESDDGAVFGANSLMDDMTR